MAHVCGTDLDELRQLVAELRKLGVAHFRSAGIDLDLGPEPLPPPPRDGIAKQSDELNAKAADDEEMLYAASEGFSS